MNGTSHRGGELHHEKIHVYVAPYPGGERQGKADHHGPEEGHQLKDPHDWPSDGSKDHIGHSDQHENGQSYTGEGIGPFTQPKYQLEESIHPLLPFGWSGHSRENGNPEKSWENPGFLLPQE
jgi:hypothetical protein